MPSNYDIIIIGAGAAGLMAGAELSKAGKKILILEARNRIGGRIQTIHEKDFMYEAGAEFIHGDLPVTFGLLREGRIKSIRMSGRRKRSERGTWVTEKPYAAAWDQLLDQMGRLKKDLVFQDFLNKHYKNKNQAELRQWFIRFAQGFDLVDIRRGSTLELYKEWKKNHHSQYRIRGGYGLLTEYLAKKCIKLGGIISTGEPVNRVEWKKKEVIVTSQSSQYTCAQLIVAIPHPLFSNNQPQDPILFEPRLTKIEQAFRQIGWGEVIKVLLFIDKAIWQKNEKIPSFIISDQIIPTWWTQEHEKGYLFTGWLGGPAAEKYGKQQDSILLQKAIQSLAVIFDLDTGFLATQVVACHIFNWHADKWAQGGYSYPKLRTSKARKLLNVPLDETIFFAGESVYQGDSPGTVEAALCSGKEAAAKLLKLSAE